MDVSICLQGHVHGEDNNVYIPLVLVIEILTILGLNLFPIECFSTLFE